MPDSDRSPSEAPAMPPPGSPQPLVSAEVEISDPDLLMAVTGPSNERLKLFERGCGLSAGVRGDVIHLQGSAEAVGLAERVLAELMAVVRDGSQPRDGEITASIRLLRDHPGASLSDLFGHRMPGSGPGARIVTPRGLAQKYYMQAIESHDIVFGVGPAGTGKTYLAMAMAVSALTSQRVKRIILTRPAVEAGEKLGFLPGDMADKVDPYVRPLYDALYDMLPAQRVHKLLERDTIEVAPLAFMRGRTLNDSFIILDEAQNTSIAQMRMFLTRVGQRSKAVITGDMTQVDLPEDKRSGLIDAVTLLGKVDGLLVCHFSSADVVRHPLVQRIVDAYDERDARSCGERGG
ncbi:MAG: PhoH family protein [Myxococcales bacterium]|nr:PhoH family protein [Myxococcales bacterium]